MWTTSPRTSRFPLHKPGRMTGFPLDLTTLYRWFRRLAFRLTLLLTMLEKELLGLAPETDLTALQKLIVRHAAVRCAVPPSADMRSANHSALTLHALCQSSLGLTTQLLRTTGKLLHTPQDKKLPPLLFLNFFCWQKTGQALLSPLPQKPHPPTRKGFRAIIFPPTHFAHGIHRAIS